ncbi:MAG TPA: DUF3160 domain-containing protein [Kofleriaceae bacterium]|nr:DUF3160 domain-containing protein [Kofleriaceae bacterium]
MRTAALVITIASCSSTPPARVTAGPASPPIRASSIAAPADASIAAPVDDVDIDPKAGSLPSDGGVCDPRFHRKLESTILATRDDRAGEPRHPWDHKTPPAYRDLVASAFSLSAVEQAQLARTGFVVPARLAYDNYISAYYDIHRAEIPIVITADSIFHAVFASADLALTSLELARLRPALVGALDKMATTLPAIAGDYPAETAQDLDLYLVVARRLLDVSVPSSNKQADELVELVTTASAHPTIELFGRRRQFDATMFTPRGHYDDSGELTAYFRAAMWMSRVELNLVSRDSRSSSPIVDPTETPREAVLAIALADLADRSGALADLEIVDGGWGQFAGRREDVSLRDLLALRTKAGITKLAIPDSATRLRAAIGNDFRRTVNVHAMPDVAELPVVATIIGPRITADTVALGRAQAAGATISPAAEIGFLLGHDRATAYLEPTVSRRALIAARAQLAAAPVTTDLYDSWLRAILALAKPVAGAKPSFMDTDAFADLRLDTAITAYGQLRHDNLLVVAQMHNGGGCEIPDGYVEPVPEAYDALATYMQRAGQVFADLAPTDTMAGYYARAEPILRVLAAISRDELAGRSLDDDEKHFLAEVVEQRVVWSLGYNGTYPGPTYDGWYVDLLGPGAHRNASFVADFGTHTRGHDGWVDYIGAMGPRMAVFVVDTGGQPRMMVGPVAHGFGHIARLARRETDASKIPASAPWERSYAVAAPPEPDLSIGVHRPIAIAKPKGAAPERGPDHDLWIEAPHPLGAVTIELRDHHFRKIGELHTRVTDKVKLEIPSALAPDTESVVVVVGAFRARVDIQLSGWGHAEFGSAKLDYP